MLHCIVLVGYYACSLYTVSLSILFPLNNLFTQSMSFMLREAAFRMHCIYLVTCDCLCFVFSENKHEDDDDEHISMYFAVLRGAIAKLFHPNSN